MGLKNYFAPGRVEDKGEKTVETTVELAESPKAATFNPTARATSPPVSLPVSGNGTRENSRPGSLFPVGDFRNNTIDEINDIKCDVMVNWLHAQQEEKLWTSGEPEEGVVLKKSRGQYTCCPRDLAEERAGFFNAVRTLNVRVSLHEKYA